jgi:hypothetical protein
MVQSITQVTRKPKHTPEEQAAYDDMRASPSIIMEFDGVVEFDSEAERTGTPSLVGQRLPPPKKRHRRRKG